jgi:hypothetical protein
MSGIVLLVFAALAVAAPLIEEASGLDSNAVDLLARFRPPSPGLLLGTDELGRDLALRLLQGGRVSLGLGLVAALAAAVIGTAIGLAAGYRGGWADALLMRLTDGIIALPLLPLLIVLAAIDLTRLGLPPELAQSPEMSFYRMAAIIALFGWTTGRRAAAHSARPHPAQSAVAGDRRHHALDRLDHPDGVRAELPRPRHPAAAAELGQHADQRAGADLVGARPRCLAGAAHLRHCHRLQPAGRRVAGRPRPPRHWVAKMRSVIETADERR